MSEQSTFAAFSPDPEPEPTAPQRPLDAEDGCPWCLAPPVAFRETAMGLGCGVCEASLPTETEWFSEGHKIVSPRDAARMYQGYWFENFAE